jgi:hypothetical protein
MRNKELNNSLEALKKLTDMVNLLSKKKVEEAVKELEQLQKLVKAEQDKR